MALWRQVYQSIGWDKSCTWHFDFLIFSTDCVNQSSPVEPFGGTDDFDVSNAKVIYTTKDPELPVAWHTRQNVYLVDILGGKPKELTGGDHGAVHSPVLSSDGKKAAWLQLDKDGYEADRYVRHCRNFAFYSQLTQGKNCHIRPSQGCQVYAYPTVGSVSRHTCVLKVR